MEKTYECLRDIIEEQIKQISKKGDAITPQEMASLKDALSALDKIDKRTGESMNYSEGYHYGPKRSPVTGRYVSYGNTHNYGNRLTYGSDHYSRHSIKDRMIARLEPMYDEATSEHERQMIANTISRIQHEG